MEGVKQANGSPEHHDGDSVCRNTQLVPIERYKRAKQSKPATSFRRFPELPWELRRLVWVFALPRSVFMSTVLRPTDCVPYPPMGRACHEARLVANEFGSMVTAWNERFDGRCRKRSRAVNGELICQRDVPNKADVCVRTWFSSKLDTLVLNMVPCLWTEHGQNDFVDFPGFGKSAVTHLVLRYDPFGLIPKNLEYVYRTYLKGRTEILLSIKSCFFIVKDQACNMNMGLDVSPRPGERDKIIRLDDAVALTKCLKLWNECHRSETCSIFDGDYGFGKWLEMALDDARGAGTDRRTRTYEAWKVEDQAYEQRLVSPKAYFLLRTVDGIISRHNSVKQNGQDTEEDTDEDTDGGMDGGTDGYKDEISVRRANEVMDDTGRLKEDHPLVQKLEIKLPQVIPVCTLRFVWEGRC